MIELQGHIEMSNAAQTESSLAIGRMCVSQTEGKLSLFVGMHQLEGKKQKLKKPLVVIEPKLSNEGRRQYEVAAIVREKLVFDAWPKPLVNRPTFKRARVA